MQWARWPTRRRLSPGELVPALMVALITQEEVWAPVPGFPHPQSWMWWHASAYLLTSLALAWRRRVPVLVLAVVAAVSTVEYLVAGAPEGLGTFLPALVALFAVGRHAPARELTIAAPLALLGTAVHDLRDPLFELGGAAVTYWAVLATAWPVGNRLRRHAQRAERAEFSGLTHSREAVQAERARIARDLHDVVGHAVGVVVVQSVAGTAQLRKGRYDETAQRLAVIEGTAREALAEMRRLVDVLDAPESAADTAEETAAPSSVSLAALVERVRSSGLDAHLRESGEPRSLPPGLGLATYRLVQEALTNTLRHAGMVTVTVAVDYQPGAVEVTVLDTGPGVNGSAPPDTGRVGRGLVGMRERVSLYGGQFRAGPAPDGGFSVHARLPVGPEGR